MGLRNTSQATVSINTSDAVINIINNGETKAPYSEMTWEVYSI